MNLEKRKANLTTRIGAAIIDFFIYFVLLMISQNLIFSNIIAAASDYKQQYETYQNECLNTGMFVKDDETNEIVAVIANEFEIDKAENYDKIIVDLYNSYNAKNELDAYEKSKLESDAFVQTDGKLTFSDNEDAVLSFFNIEMGKAYDYVLKNNETLSSAYGRLTFLNTINELSSSLFSALIIYLLFPLIFKQGQTLGKKFLRVYVVSAKSEEETVSKVQILVRQLSFIVLLCLSIFTAGIPVLLLISSIVMAVTKNKVSIEDLIASTVVLDHSENNNEEYIVIDKRIKVTPPVNDVETLTNDAEQNNDESSNDSDSLKDSNEENNVHS